MTNEKIIHGTLHSLLSANQPDVWCVTPASGRRGGGHMMNRATFLPRSEFTSYSFDLDILGASWWHN